jgi:hypothetical protein
VITDNSSQKGLFESIKMEVSQEGLLLVLGHQRRHSVFSLHCVLLTQDVQIHISGWIVLWLGASSSCRTSTGNSWSTV